jgi:FG-GAP-like repeat/FG-GAP repeat
MAAAVGLLALSATDLAAQQNASLIISEFRTRGPNGQHDEFVEIYNPSNRPVTIQSGAGSMGYAVVASDGVDRFWIPNGTVIPARGHFLGANVLGYSLSAYPGGVGSGTHPDGVYIIDIPDGTGIALFTSTNPAEWDLAHRLDAVGSDSEANTLYREGTGYEVNAPSLEHSYARFFSVGLPFDGNHNANDFHRPDTVASPALGLPNGFLGAPGPENLSSPVQTGVGIAVSLLDPTADAGAAPNLARSNTPDPTNNSTFGTLSIRRVITNNTGVPLTKLRVRMISITQITELLGTADLRVRSSNDVTATVPGVGTVTVRGTTLEGPSQPLGGGFNSSLGVPLDTPLAPGASIAIQILFGVERRAHYSLAFNVEALPTGGAAFVQIAGNTEPECASVVTPPLAVFSPAGGSGSADITIGQDCVWTLVQRPTWLTPTSPTSGQGNGFVSYVVQTLTARARRMVNMIVANGISTILQLGRALSDFDFDGRADVVVYRPASGQWWVSRSTSNFTSSFMVPWGLPTDQPVPADFDGDGKVDPTVFRPAGSGASSWFVKRSSSNYTDGFAVIWGDLGDVPVPGYYDTDAVADAAVFRPSTGHWLIRRSTQPLSAPMVVQWGVSTDVPVAADYDCDGRTDVAIYRPSTGQWFITRSDTQFPSWFVITWGAQAQGDVPLPADYDGDGCADPAVYRPGTGQWLVKRSGTGYFSIYAVQWGVQGLSDQPMPGDFDGDGRADLAVYRPGTGQWLIARSSSNYTTYAAVQWGNQSLGDLPIRER